MITDAIDSLGSVVVAAACARGEAEEGGVESEVKGVGCGSGSLDSYQI
jgi:hypothetical protein